MTRWQTTTTAALSALGLRCFADADDLLVTAEGIELSVARHESGYWVFVPVGDDERHAGKLHNTVASVIADIKGRVRQHDRAAGWPARGRHPGTKENAMSVGYL
jgi:hypothetical protein